MSTQQHYYQTPGHVMAAGVGLAIVDAVAVLLRFGARRDSKQPLKVDDWLLLPATVRAPHFIVHSDVFAK